MYFVLLSDEVSPHILKKTLVERERIVEVAIVDVELTYE